MKQFNQVAVEKQEINTTFKYYPVMFGKWDKSYLTMSFKEFDTLTHESLNKSNKALKDIKTQFRHQLKEFTSMGINEVNKASDGYFHLLFDVDEVKDIEGVENALTYFDNLSVRFGNYAISGYTKDEAISEKYNISLCEEANKVFSAHVVFYETKASLDMIKAIFGKDEHKQYINNNVLYQDDSIWESIIKGKSHMMRACISNKLMNEKGVYVEKITCSNVINRKGETLPNSYSLITVRGDEREITPEDIAAVGIVPRTDKTIIKPVKVIKDNEEQEVKPLNENELINITYSQLATLLNNIYDPVNMDTTHELLKIVAGCLAHAGHVFTDKNKLNEVIYNWYNDNGENPHAQDEAGSNYINTYYEQESKNNNWFYGLVKLINNEEVRQKYISKYNIINDFDASEFIENENDKEEVKQVIDTINDNFANSNYTFDTFYETEFKDINELLRKLKLCVAFNKRSGGVIVKHNEEYEEMKKTAFIENYNKIYTFNIDGKNTDIPLRQFIYKSKYCDKLTYYDNTAIYSNKPGILSLWIPPTKTTYNKHLISLFFGYYLKVVKNLKPFTEFIDSLAYKLRNPDAIITKIFINIGNGHDGKSLLFAVIDAIFNIASMITQRDQITADKFNVWQEALMFLGIEELQTDNMNYDNMAVNKILEKFLKLLTTPNTARRGMGKELKKGTNKFILDINSNDPFVDGLIFTKSEAIIERLVLIEYKKLNDMGACVDKMANETFKGINKEEFVYSLYYYLRYEHKISDDYNPERYHGEEKITYINTVKQGLNTYITRWIKENMTMFAHSYKVKEIKYYYFTEEEGNNNFKYYCKLNNINRNEWLNTLLTLNIGFEHLKTNISGKTYRIIRIAENEFNKWANINNDVLDEVKIISDDEPLEENAAFDKWINEHIKIIDNKQVILGSDIKRGKEGKDIRDYILSLGYKEAKHIKYNNKEVRGFTL